MPEHAISMIDGTRNRAWLFWLGLGLSLVIHVGLAAHLVSRAAQDFGATDLPTTAISVNIESSDILESVEESQASQSAPSSPWTAGEPIPPQEAEPEKAEAPTPTEPEKAETQPPLTETPEDQSAKEAARRSELAAQLEQQRIAEGALRRAAEAQREKQAAEAEREKHAAEQRARDKARQLAEDQEAREEREAETGETEKNRRATENQKKAEKLVRKKSGDHTSSAGASGSRGAKAATGRVSASQGAVGYYSGTVNAWIARNKPSRAGARGRVVVELAVSTSGQLTFARIASSSGNQSLDQIALAAVRRSSPFPQPPPGSTPAQLRFTFPFRFE